MKSKDDNFKTRDRQGGNRYFIDNAFLRTWGAKLGPHCIAVYNVLVMHANADSQTAFPSFQTIADMTGMSRRQAMREIKKLEEKNIIRVDEVSTPAADPTKKIYSSNVFTLLHPDIWVKIEDQSLYEPSDTQSLGVGTDSHQPSDTQSPPLVTQSHPNKTNPNKTTTRDTAAQKLETIYLLGANGRSSQSGVDLVNDMLNTYPAEVIIYACAEAEKNTTPSDDKRNLKYIEAVCKRKVSGQPDKIPRSTSPPPAAVRNGNAPPIDTERLERLKAGKE